MGKYEPLTQFLNKQGVSMLPMTFKEIERVIGARLPDSAFRHRPWWSNSTSNNVMTQAWLDAGWITSDVDVPGQKLIFRRTSKTKPAPSAPYPTAETTLEIKGLSEDTVKWLDKRAAASGRSVAETAADLLTQHAKPSFQEWLAEADKMRAAGPKVRDIDMVAIMRADRDSR